MNEWIMRPLVQYGFVGFAAVLLGFVIWLVHKLIQLLEANGRIIAANTQAVERLTAIMTEVQQRDQRLYEKIISRPCIAGREQHEND